MPAGRTAQMNKLDLLFENTKISYDMLLSKERFVSLIRAHAYLLDDVSSKLEKHRAKIRILVENAAADEDNNLIDMIEKMKWPAVDLTIKATDYYKQAYYTIADDELWFPLETTNDIAKSLVSDNKRLVTFARENFDKCWGDPRTRTLFQQERDKILQKRERTTKSKVQPQSVPIGR